MPELKITEIFHSLQGESSTVGLPTVFIRLTACPLRCQYCDTEYAFTGGKNMTINDILAEASAYEADYVCVTGGEPLIQDNVHRLLKQLCDQGYKTSLETCGAYSLEGVDPRVSIIMDIKTPDSGEADKNLWSNLKLINPKRDEIKFVICSREDYEWSCDIVEHYQLMSDYSVLLSPSFGEIEAADLADWIIEDHLKVRFQVQLHKQLWSDEMGR